MTRASRCLPGVKAFIIVAGDLVKVASCIVVKLFNNECFLHAEKISRAIEELFRKWLRLRTPSVRRHSSWMAEGMICAR